MFDEAKMNLADFIKINCLLPYYAVNMNNYTALRNSHKNLILAAKHFVIGQNVYANHVLGICDEEM